SVTESRGRPLSGTLPLGAALPPGGTWWTGGRWRGGSPAALLPIPDQPPAGRRRRCTEPPEVSPRCVALGSGPGHQGRSDRGRSRDREAAPRTDRGPPAGLVSAWLEGSTLEQKLKFHVKHGLSLEVLEAAYWLRRITTKRWGSSPSLAVSRPPISATASCTIFRS